MLDLLSCQTVDEVIETIFEKSYCISEEDYYYMQLKNFHKEDFDNLHCFYRLSYIVEQKAKKIILGENLSVDYENRLQEGRYILFDVLDQVFNGDCNEKLEMELEINSLEDLKKIIKSELLSRRLCNYILQYVEISLRKYTQQKSNPDYYYYNNEYVNINYEYVDAENDSDYNPLEKITYCSIEYGTGDMSRYILKTFMKDLTVKQQIFVKNYLLYEVCSDGAIRNHDNLLLYSKQNVLRYKQCIRKRLEKKIEEDLHIDISNGRWIYKG